MLSKISYSGLNYPYNMLKREQNLGSDYAYMLKQKNKNSRVAFKLRSI